MGAPDPQIPRDVAERVLRRAAEMTPAVDGPDGTWADQGMSEQVLLDAAAEVGIAPEAVHRALAIEKLGVEPPTRRTDRLLGPSEVTVEVETTWSPDDTLRLVDAWLVMAHHLRRERTRPDGGEWRRRHDVAAKVQRGLRGLNGEGRLGDSEAVRVTAVPVGTTHTIVRLTIDRSTQRGGYAAAGGGVAAAGVAGAVVLGVLVTPVIAVAAPVAAVGGVAVARSGRGGADRARREAERMLDAVRRGEWPRRVSDDLRDAFRSRKR